MLEINSSQVRHGMLEIRGLACTFRVTQKTRLARTFRIALFLDSLSYFRFLCQAGSHRLMGSLPPFGSFALLRTAFLRRLAHHLRVASPDTSSLDIGEMLIIDGSFRLLGFLLYDDSLTTWWAA